MWTHTFPFGPCFPIGPFPHWAVEVPWIQHYSHSILSTIVHHGPLSSTVAHHWPLLSTLTHCCPLLSTLTHSHPLLSTVVHCCPPLSTIVHSCPQLSTLACRHSPSAKPRTHYRYYGPLQATTGHYGPLYCLWSGPGFADDSCPLIHIHPHSSTLIHTFPL